MNARPRGRLWGWTHRHRIAVKIMTWIQVNGYLGVTVEKVSGYLEKNLSECKVRTWPQVMLLWSDSCLTLATGTIYLRTTHLTNLMHHWGRISKIGCQDAFLEDISIGLSSIALFSLSVPLVLLHFL